ncbi:hypothetical protein N7509_000260 [Penicillium cosmopolitanum]|uniref:BED-type domain-containing protein n=1 Tax=Penicillium cosmopolitanum TaxID=1131564 RepID=A0A9W9WAA8_9EURO|nr:uncharacterized protein N7509_000260 [Penicillium cosmopolitanum]KAJ5413633.1 hypothetical protein N7509_000260 [Penicillium cosmopolitanum]
MSYTFLLRPVLDRYRASSSNPSPPDALHSNTSGSTADISFIRSQSISPPKIFEHVGPLRKKSFVLWTEMVNDEFVAWWLKTEFGSRINRNLFEDKRGAQTAECWKHFHQVAAISDGEPRVMCKTCDHTLTNPADGHRGTSSMNKHYQGSVKCRKKTPHSKDIRKLIQKGAHLAPQKSVFTNDAWIERILIFLSSLQLPFQLVEHPQFRALVETIRLAPSMPEIPTSITIRRRLQVIVKERQQGLLQTLPEGGKLSIALDSWTSPFRQAFMAVTGYFIEHDWNYREILLGFEPVHGSHTGINLGAVLFPLLQKHGIEDRVLIVATDNASNNSTLVESLKGSIQGLKLPSNIPIIRMPCIAHVIQLSLKELLGQMEANPKNEREEMDFTGGTVSSRRENHEIIYTLNKVRKLAVHINRSPQRREHFLGLQTKEPKLVPMQDVKTRWNSTFLMLRRAKRLQSTFDEFCRVYNHVDLQLSEEEWRQVEYLLSITQPFFSFTNEVSKSKDITIHTVFGIYNALFAHLEKSKRQLVRKKVNWKTAMLKELVYARKKLSQYRRATDDVGDDLYQIATIMAPQNKIEFFQKPEWEPKWAPRYRKSLEKYLIPYEKRYLESQPMRDSVPSAAQVSNLELMVSTAQSSESQTSVDDELRRYLGSSTRLINPRLFWKDHENELPILASLARDVLSTPASGAGVERLFNCARDICHFRRGSLKPKPIQDLMMMMCTTRFDVESEKLAFIDEYLSTQEIHEKTEEKEAQKKKEEVFDLISDDEEEEEDSTDDATSKPTQLVGESILGKRPRVGTTPTDLLSTQAPPIQLEDGEGEQDEPPLPENSSTQRRTSGRVPKRIRRDEDLYEYQKP